LIEGCVPPGGQEGDAWTINPLTMIAPSLFDIVDTWLDLRRIMGSNEQVILPEAGGFLDQPAALMECFSHLDYIMAQTRTDASE
jgi:hypothetical protein